MRTTCTICRHEKRDKIDVELEAGKPTRKLAVEFKVSRDSLVRHQRNHLQGPHQANQKHEIVPHPASAITHQRQQLNLPDAWERQPGESRPAFAAFQVYLELSARRPDEDVPYWEVAARVAKSRTMIARWGAHKRQAGIWRERRDAWLIYVDRARAARLAQETEQARERWRTNGRTLQDLGAQRIAAINPQKLPVDEARRFVVDGAVLEARGLALENNRVALQVTNQTANIQIAPERAREIVQRFLARAEREQKEQATIEVPPRDR
jgi:hypothetical protein